MTVSFLEPTLRCSVSSGDWNDIHGNIPIVSTHPIFSGVDTLYHDWGQDILDLAPGDPNNEIVATYNGHALYAVFTPEPATLSLLALGGFALLRRRR